MANVRAARDGSFFMFILGFVACCVSYGSPYWYSAGLRHEGIWRTCAIVGDTTECETIIGLNSDAWMRGVQAMMTLAVFWQLFSLISYCMWLQKDSDVIRKRGMTPDGKMALSFNCLAGVSMACAVISYGSMFDSRNVSSLSWAFLLAIISAFLQLFVSLVTLAATCCEGPEGHKVTGEDMELQIQVRT